MAGQRNNVRLKAIASALSHVTRAMDLLDAHGIAPDVSASLAVAQQRLRHIITTGDP